MANVCILERIEKTLNFLSFKTEIQQYISIQLKVLKALSPLID